MWAQIHYLLQGNALAFLEEHLPILQETSEVPAWLSRDYSCYPEPTACMHRMCSFESGAERILRKRVPRVVGLTGGVAAGKSALAARLRRRGAGYYSVDAAAHALYGPGRRVWREVVRIFGRDIIDSDGSIDRKKLGCRVRASARALACLERAVHPALRREARAAIRRMRRRFELTVVEAGPLLFRLGLDRETDLVVWLECPRRVRLARLKSAKDLSRDEAESWLRSYRPAELSLRRDFRRAPNRIRVDSGRGTKWLERAERRIAIRAFETARLEHGGN